jgi:hypothetical protein
MPEPAPNDGRAMPTLTHVQARVTTACARYQRAAYVRSWCRAHESFRTTPPARITTLRPCVL